MSNQWNYSIPQGQIPAQVPQASWQPYPQQHQQYPLSAPPQGGGARPVMHQTVPVSGYIISPGMGGATMFQPRPTGGVPIYYQQQPMYSGGHIVPPQSVQVQQQVTAEEQQQRQRQLELEEQKRKDIERQKLRLQSVKVSNPVSSAGGASISSLESLIGFDPKLTPKNKPKTSETSKATPTTTITPISDQTTVAAPPTTAPPTVAPPTTALPPNTSGPSIDELLVNSMSKLDDKINRPVTKSDFKNTSMKHSSSPNTASSRSHQFVLSSKARSWQEQGDEFSGLFTVHTAAAAAAPEAEDSFGEFQSVSSDTAPVTAMGLLSQGGGGPMNAYMSVPSIDSPQLVHSQLQSMPLMATSASSQATVQQQSLPVWFYSMTLPPVYSTVYQKCAIDGSDFTDTQRLFPLLVSSGLERGALRDLWNIVNKTTPGQLTRTELYTLLALIGLAQMSGKTAVTLVDLKATVSPPIPHLSAVLLPEKHETSDEFGDFQSMATSSGAVVSRVDNRHYSPVIGAPTQDRPSLVTDMPPDPLLNDNSCSALSTLSQNGSLIAPLSDGSIRTNENKDDPYSALKGLTSSQDQHLTQGNDDDPYSALKGLTSSQDRHLTQGNNDDPYSALKNISQNHSMLSQPVPSTGNVQNISDPYSVALSSSSSVTLTTPLATAVVSSTAPTDGWADFSSFPATNNGDTLFAATYPQSIPKSPSDDDFTEFSTYQQPLITTYITSSPPPLSPAASSNVSSGDDKGTNYSEIWHKCLSKSLNLLEQCQTVLTAEDDKEILKELFSCEEGQAKLRGIAELYRFAKRLHTTSRGAGKHFMTPLKNESLTGLMMSIKRTWASICNLFPDKTMTEVMASLSTASSNSSLTTDESDKCFLCLLPSHIFISPLVTIDGCSEQYTLSTVRLEDRFFHVQCANFWRVELNQEFEYI